MSAFAHFPIFELRFSGSLFSGVGFSFRILYGGWVGGVGLLDVSTFVDTLIFPLRSGRFARIFRSVGNGLARECSSHS